jgi:hypothetical protein
MAKMTMNAVTSIAQTNSGMRLSDMPGARALKIVATSLNRHRQRGHLGKRDELRPEIRAFAGA